MQTQTQTPFNGNRPTSFAHGVGNAAIQTLQEDVRRHSQWVAPLEQEVARVIVGQRFLVQRLLVGLLTSGHVLLEGVPGLAKTLSLKTLAGALHAQFRRVQFTPDMLPADIVGTLIYNPREGDFVTKRGPVFSNIVLADEINRAPAKVQSALLEAMQEHQVTLGEATFKLPEPFLVMATQNPIEQEGTYPLPEAQIDRFMLKLVVGYPTQTEERAILDAMATSEPDLAVREVVGVDEILASRRVVNRIYVDDRLKDYIVALVAATRDPAPLAPKMVRHVQFGASPRASISLTLAAKANAFLQGRGYVTPLDVKVLAHDVLRHRIVRTYEAEAEGVTTDHVIDALLEALPVP
jgi:MoxR-like ATPase